MSLPTGSQFPSGAYPAQSHPNYSLVGGFGGVLPGFAYNFCVIICV